MKSSSKVLAFLMTILLLAGIAAGCKGTVTPDDNGTNTNSGSNNNGTNNGTNSGSNNGNPGNGSGNTNSNNGSTNQNPQNGNGGGNTSDTPSANTQIVFTISYSQENDIQVTSMRNGNMLIFTSEECDLYTWRLNDQEYANTKSCSINLGNYIKGTYTLSLEAFKDSKWYSFFAQIIVE